MTRQRIVDESSPAAAALFTWLLNDTESNQTSYTIGWHDKSFSIRRRLAKSTVAILYCYPSRNKFSVYLGELKHSDAVLAELRRSLLSLNTLSEAGKHTLQADVDEHNGERLKHVFHHLINELERYGHRE